MHLAIAPSGLTTKTVTDEAIVDPGATVEVAYLGDRQVFFSHRRPDEAAPSRANQP